ncbi:MAG: noncanonical pyrimidine nucleotidase, YjjG family, partial [Clostridia bacterium]
MRRFDVLLCDADNTLFDFDACEKVALRRACAALALPCDEAICRVYAQINAALWAAYERNEMTQVALRRVRFTQLLAHLHAVADADALGKAYTDALGQTALMIPGALEMVRQVAAWMPIYLFTNGIGSVQRSRLAASPLSDWIVGMVISEEVGVAKPDP